MSTPSWSNLAKVVYKRTYARRVEDGRTENWNETVERAISGNIRGHNVSEQEVERLRYFLTNRKSGPAGRGWWFSGTEGHTRLGGAALCNCWFLTAEDWTNFVIAQDLLMLGGGVGMSVEHRFVSKLPRVKKGVVVQHRLTKDAEFIVPDSREGWNELARRVYESFFVTGKSFTYSTICVRGSGEVIKGFGGTASGAGPLIEFVTKLCSILISREGKSIRPVDAADIICATGEMVVAGNIRRSAIIILGDPWDKDYLRAKRWDLGNVPSQRGYANWSVVCDDVEDLHPLFWKTYEHGEPYGLVNRANMQQYARMGEKKKDTALGVNPCQPPWAPILTPSGIKQLGDVKEGDEVWSGQRWTKVKRKWSTGVKPVYAYRTNAGVFFGTENHRIVEQGVKIEVKDAEMIDISVGDSASHQTPLDPQDVLDGWVFGDGMAHKASGGLVGLIVGNKDGDIHKSEVAHLIGEYRPGIDPRFWTCGTTMTAQELPKTYLRQVPDRFFYGTPAKVRGFLRGLYSANGSVCGSRITLKAVSFEVIEQVQQMLSSLGIASYYTTNRAHDTEFSNGIYTCRQSYDLNISTNAGRSRFLEVVGFVQDYKNEKAREVTSTVSNGRSKSSFEIVSHEYLGHEEVFDIEVEADEHTYWTGGLLVSNCAEATLEDGEPCNLYENALPNFDSTEEFLESVRLGLRWTKRVTCEKYHHQKSDEVIKRNRRVGIGITGCMEAPELFNPEVLDRAYAAIQDEDETYSKELGINRSIRTTVVKPSGTMSKVMDVRGEGIHGGWSRHQIQRIRFAADDPLVPKLRAAGHHIEQALRIDGSTDPRTVVVDFYLEAPASLPTADEGWDTWKQLDVVKLAQKHWSDQSVSVTVYYKREELPALKAWLADNYRYLKTISFLCHSDHGFKQAPKEAITEEQYKKLSPKIKPLDTEAVGEGGELDGSECAGGACPVR